MPDNSPAVVDSYVFDNPLNIAALPTERAGIKPMRIELFDFLPLHRESVETCVSAITHNSITVPGLRRTKDTYVIPRSDIPAIVHKLRSIMIRTFVVKVTVDG